MLQNGIHILTNKICDFHTKNFGHKIHEKINMLSSDINSILKCQTFIKK
jgi:hypothetical protein